MVEIFVNIIYLIKLDTIIFLPSLSRLNVITMYINYYIYYIPKITKDRSVRCFV